MTRRKGNCRNDPQHMLLHFGWILLCLGMQSVAICADGQIIYSLNVRDGTILRRTEAPFCCFVRSLAEKAVIFKQVRLVVNGDEVLPPIDEVLFDVNKDGTLSQRRASPEERSEYENVGRSEFQSKRRFGEVVGNDKEELYLRRTYGVDDKIEFLTNAGEVHYLVDLGGKYNYFSGFRGNGIHVFVAVSKDTSSKTSTVQIHCYEPQNRKLVWKTDVRNVPMIGSCNGGIAFHNHGSELFAMSALTSCCIDGATGGKQWSVKLTAAGVEGDPEFPGVGHESISTEYLRPVWYVVGTSVILVWSEGVACLDHKTGKQQWIRLIKDNKPFTIKSAGVKDNVVLLTVGGTEPKDLFVKLKTAKDATQK